ncbi:MAG: zf-HC2 domain-containing protein [Pseudogulbenkiania sp.]|nr:zf-HC2 domain-containing protein [Pseudogulbenkiania sp.]
MKINCKQASRLISDALDRPLSKTEYLRLRIHLFLCGNCSEFSRQLQLLQLAARKAGRGE